MSKTRANRYGSVANNPFNVSTFPIKGLSQFDWSHTTSFTQDFGDLRPVACFDLGVGNRMSCNLAYVLNMDPLRKPLYAGIDVTFDAIYVSDMLLGYDSEAFFNPANHVSVGVSPTSVEQPSFNLCSLLVFYYCSFPGPQNSFVKAPSPIYNTLVDALGYPFDSYYYDNMIHEGYSVSDFGSSPVNEKSLADLLNPFSSLYVDSNGAIIFDNDEKAINHDKQISFKYLYYSSIGGVPVRLGAISVGSPGSGRYGILGFWHYLELRSTIQGSFEYDMDLFFHELESKFGGNSPLVAKWDVDAMCRYLGYDSYQAALDAYKSYVYVSLHARDFYEDKVIDLRPIFAYKTAYNDLYVNTNLHDCDDYRLHAIDTFYQSIVQSVAILPPSGWAVSSGANYLNLFYVSDTAHGGVSMNVIDIAFEKRWWSNDMFTSAVPADLSAAANSVEIPSTGLTIMDLRGYNISQMVAEKMMYAGQRVTDTTFAVFGFRSPELRYRFARHIGRFSDRPKVDNVLQNSESTQNSPLATPAGYGYGSRSGNFFDYQMPWYGFIMILNSVMTHPVYRDAVDYMLFKKDYEDFIFPDYQELGDVSVDSKLIGPNGATGVFGWQRSYFYMMRKNSTLRGKMRLQEKIDWNLSRDLHDGFALNADFAKPNSSDRLNRIFSDTSDGTGHFNFFVGLDLQVVLPLRRDIHYHL